MDHSIIEALRNLTHIRAVSPSSLVNRRSFWCRCSVVHPKWWYDENEPYEHDPSIFVDGIVNAAKWNCWRTYSQTENGNVCLWLGFALTRGTWTEHSWCALGDKIIETEDAHDIYYGAELSPEEYRTIAERCRTSDLSARENARLWTMGMDGYRTIVPYDPALHADAIGRPRDRVTNEPMQDFKT